jgi:hypothetical protein
VASDSVIGEKCLVFGKVVTGGSDLKVYEFGNKNNPVILLLPGTCCLWKRNFGAVIDKLAEKFCVACVSYDGFDETEQTEFDSELTEVQKIERYVIVHYNSVVHAAYGCSLGGSIVGLLVARNIIKIKYGILGSSDLDHSDAFFAWVKTGILIPAFYKIIQRGEIRNPILRKQLQRKLVRSGAVGEALCRMIDLKGGSLRFVSEKSMRNQYYTDLVTSLPDHISVPGTKVIIFYALKMGKKYRTRYIRHFVDPFIIESDMYHEELLAVHPEQWIYLIENIVLQRLVDGRVPVGHSVYY